MIKNILSIIFIATATICCKGKAAEKNETPWPADFPVSSNASDIDEDTLCDTILIRKMSVDEGESDYFENDEFLLDNFAKEIDSAIYYEAVKLYENGVDTTKKIAENAGVFRLELDNGEIDSLINIGGKQDNRIVYRSEGFVDAAKSYLFSFISYEGRGAKMISRSDGTRYQLPAAPYLSPDNTHLITIRTDEEGETCGTIELFSVNLGEVNFVAGLWSYRILPIEGGWNAEQCFCFKAEYVVDNERYIKYYLLNI